MPSSTKNRAFWNSISDAYQAAHGARLTAEALAWGVWRIPESQLDILGEVQGRDILELGCGAAQWTLALSQRAARAVGLDLSDQQLSRALALSKTGNASAGIQLVQGDAENLPFRAGSFDIVFCDHGATVFATPEHTVAEASRVLRPNGLFCFCMSTPIRDICFDPVVDAVTSQLTIGYFGLSEFQDGASVEYQLPYGAWIRLFRRCGFTVEDLVELQAPAQAATTYTDFVSAGWAQKWPAEHIWKLKKAA
jgi:SAM-dependent methyltransferase